MTLIKRVRELGRPVATLTDLYRLRVNGHTLGETNLPKGAGDRQLAKDPLSGNAYYSWPELCVMQMVEFARLGRATDDTTVTDSPPSSSRLRDWCITLNDALGEGPRQRLKEYVPRLARTSTANDDAVLKVIRDFDLGTEIERAKESGDYTAIFAVLDEAIVAALDA